ncbi:Uma2 family endonuclease [Deltaproteobacteria bacterium TL4]
MNWQEVCADPNLQNLPYKIELNEQGQIIMSPVKVFHSLAQGKISHLLRTLKPEGEVAVECAIQTNRGTKVADAVWMSQERYKVVKYETECSIAPEVCVEVMSSGNTKMKMQDKRQLYFEQGAYEFWICDEKGFLSFYQPEGKMKHSLLIPDFPEKIEI